MTMNQSEVVRVFTSSSLEEILEDGGTGWWKINEFHVTKCKYAICIQNNNGPRKSIGKQGTYADQNTGFIIGQISKIVKDDESKRKLMCFNRYAQIEIKNMKLDNRNPVSYMNFADLKINIDELVFQDIPNKKIAPLTIDEAKQGLSLQYGIDCSQIKIEITF